MKFELRVITDCPAELEAAVMSLPRDLKDKSQVSCTGEKPVPVVEPEAEKTEEPVVEEKVDPTAVRQKLQDTFKRLQETKGEPEAHKLIKSYLSGFDGAGRWGEVKEQHYAEFARGLDHVGA